MLINANVRIWRVQFKCKRCETVVRDGFGLGIEFEEGFMEIIRDRKPMECGCPNMLRVPIVFETLAEAQTEAHRIARKAENLKSFRFLELVPWAL